MPEIIPFEPDPVNTGAGRLIDNPFDFGAVSCRKQLFFVLGTYPPLPIKIFGGGYAKRNYHQ